MDLSLVHMFSHSQVEPHLLSCVLSPKGVDEEEEENLLWIFTYNV